jgi:hypothetical protein
MFSGTLKLRFSFTMRDPESREKQEQDTNGYNELMVECLTGNCSLEAKHADRRISMSQSRLLFVHVVEGIVKEHIYVCALVRSCCFQVLARLRKMGGGDM